MADICPEETNQELSVSREVSQPRAASLEKTSSLIISLRGDDHTHTHTHTHKHTARTHHTPHTPTHGKNIYTDVIEP